MKTIKIDKRDNTDELAKKVLLPQPRYQSYSIDLESKKQL